MRASLAASAYAHTAQYDTMVSQWLMRQHRMTAATFPPTLPLVLVKVRDLRYGENPHQRAALLSLRGGPCDGHRRRRTPCRAKSCPSTTSSDADTATQCVRQFQGPACVIVKHANPCGVAQSVNILAAYEAAYRTDPTSAFGGIIAFNQRTGRRDRAQAIIGQQFAEVITAPAVSA